MNLTETILKDYEIKSLLMCRLSKPTQEVIADEEYQFY